MDAIETAIRNAFEKKGNALDPSFRERVYRSALAALEKSFEANRSLTVETVMRRRETARTTIDQIESEYVAAVGPETSFPPVPEAPEIQIERQMPPVVEADRGAPRAAPDVEAASPKRRRDDGEIGSNAKAKRRGSVLSRLLPAAIVILLAAGAIWWAASSGLFSVPETADIQPADSGDQASPADSADGGSLLPRPESTQDWINVFMPNDPTKVSAPANASAEAMEDDSGSFMRIRSGSDGAPVSFDVGQGILERLAGRRAVFDIVARAEEGMPTEIAVECDFGALGGCDRKRYQVNYERGDFLFDVQLPEGRPESGGAIAIISDVENAGKAADIYQIRVSVGD